MIFTFVVRFTIKTELCDDDDDDDDDDVNKSTLCSKEN